MSPEQWAEVERLFQFAADLAPLERRIFLDRECPDADMRQEVLSLLQHAGEEPRPAEAAIASAVSSLQNALDPDRRLIGARLGPYRVESIVGHGGMGAVYRAARDDAEFHQQVAIKLVRAAAESPSTLRRFRQERQILARLSHPNIARLLDGGSTPDGVPYLVMEFIEGEPITDWCRHRALSVNDRLRLFLQVCEGVDCAHRDRVVHRDLKPANILVTKDGTPKLLDFGIARLLVGDADQQSITLTSLQAMTPDYASPEQVRGEPASTPADVYALGLILYELLTGRKAQEVGTLTPSAMVKAVCETAPTVPALLMPGLAGDLDNIIRMAIRKEPERRYATAGDLAGDIQRHLKNLPVAARPDTFAYRSAKFIRRNRIAASAAAFVATVLAGGLLVESWLIPRSPRALQVVQLTQTGRVNTGLGVVTDGSRVYFTEGDPGNWIAQVSAKGGTPQPLPIPPGLSPPDIMDISRDGSQLLVASGIARERPLWVLPVSGGSARRVGDAQGQSAAWSPDARRIVFARGSALFVIDADGRNSRKLLDAPRRIGVDSISWAPDRARDVLRMNLFDPTTRVGELWEVVLNGGRPHPLLQSWTYGAGWPEGDSSGRWVPSGKYFLFRSRRGKASAVWALREDRSWLPRFDRRLVQIYSSPLDFATLAPSPDGKRVFFAAGKELIEWMRYDTRAGQFMPYLPAIAGRWVDRSRDGRWIAYTAVPEGTLWRSRPDGSERLPLTAAPLRVFSPKWSPDGTRIAFAGVRPGESIRLYVIPVAPSGAGAPEPITSGRFTEDDPSWSPDGKSLLFSRESAQGLPDPPGLYIVNIETRNAEFLPDSGMLVGPSWSPDRRYIAAATSTQLRLFDFHTRRWTLLAAATATGVPCWSRDGQHLYYDDLSEGSGHPTYRVRIADRKVERIADVLRIPQSNVTGYTLVDLSPGDEPIVSVRRSNSDLYALDVDLP